jgi:hypothetical protein
MPFVDDEKKNSAPIGALRLIANDQFASVSENESGEPRMSMTVYSGKPIEGHWYWGKLMIDGSGIQFGRSKYPVLEDHWTGSKIGFSGKPIVEGNKVILNPDNVQFVDTEEANNFIKLSKQGFPFQASIYAIPTTIECVGEHDTVDVNGFKFKGPGYVWRKSVYQEASVCVFGADKNTESRAFSETSDRVSLSLEIINNDNDNYIQSQKEVKVMPLSLDQLKSENPDLLKQIQDDTRKIVESELTAKFSVEKAKIEGENASLKDTVMQLSTTVDDQGKRLLDAEKREAIRTEKELAMSAADIWKNKLSLSKVREGLHSKIMKHVDHNQFVANGKLDVVKFTEAVESEIKDWEVQDATPFVMGSSRLSRTVADVDQLNVAEDDKVVEHLFSIAGGRVVK